jgi:hypothetical protein
MITLMLLLAMQVTVPGDMTCVGTVMDFNTPADLYVAGIEQEGAAILATEGQIVYLNGPRTGFLKVGEINSVVRPEGKVQDPATGKKLGLYYKTVGTVRIESVRNGVAAARILKSCYEMSKGDLVIPAIKTPAVEFRDEPSDQMTGIPSGGLTGSILLGENDLKELAEGHMCYINLGWRDGVQTGDRFTIYRSLPHFDRNEMEVAGATSAGDHSVVKEQNERSRLNPMLSRRVLPELILGDVVVVNVGENVSAGKIVNSLLEIHPGDSVVKR